MNRKPGIWKRMVTFLEERGYYIILFLCVGAIGISGYVLFFGNDTTTDDYDYNAYLNSLTQDFEDDELPATDDTPVLSPDTSSVEEPEPEPEPPSPDTEEAPPVVATNNPVPVPDETPFYVRPVAGEILRPYSGDELIKDKTMGDWRAHLGTDFLAVDGERVSAIADGTVDDIYFDRMLGYCIRISHSDGLASLYTGLMKNATVNIGDSVEAGDIIGGVGNTMLEESEEDMHLHVEVTKNGEHIDPMSIIPQK